jgi:OOP family OmpA-OmpF porin
MQRPFLALFLCLTPVAGRATVADLVFPFPVVAVEAEPVGTASYGLPTGPFVTGTLPVRTVEGAVDRRAYRLDAPGVSLLEVMGPLRDQLVADGYEVLLDCEAQVCGGFDFRFATDVLPEPAMHVDLGAFRFVSAARQDEVISLLVSRAGDEAFVQVIRVGPVAAAVPLPDGPAAPVTAPTPLPEGPDDAGETGDDPPALLPAPDDMTGRLDAGLPVALDDLVFASGAAALEDRDYASLDMLAGWLNADEGRAVMLVGHTDASGGLRANVALSERRAEAVRQMLIARYGAKPAQIVAEGAGPLAPRATNDTEEGRHRNRRVEAVPAPDL